MALYRISDLNISIKTNSPTLAESIKRYEVTYQAEPNVTLEMSDDRLIDLMEENEGVTADVIESTYMATLYCWALFDYNGFPIRAVGVEHDGVCTLFAAPDDESVDIIESTYMATLYCWALFDYNGFPIRAVGVEHDGVCTLFAAPDDESVDLLTMIPEDKAFVYNFPGIRMQDDDYYVFDTPFGLNGNRSKTGRKLKLSSIVFVDSARFDSLREIEAKDFVPLFMHAVAENIRNERTKHTLFVLERVMHRVKFFGVRDVNDFDFILERV